MREVSKALSKVVVTVVLTEQSMDWEGAMEAPSTVLRVWWFFARG